MMISLLAATVMAPALAAPTADAVNLVRTYKAGDSIAYGLHAEMDGMGMTVDAEIVFKVKKAMDDGAELTMLVRKFAMKRDGADAGLPGPEELTAPFDKYGMPHLMQTQGEAWVYILAAIAGLVPGKEVEVGSKFGVKWESKDKVFSTTGSGTLLEVVDHEGAKAAKIDYDIEVKPGEEDPGAVKCKTLVAIADGIAISAEGTVAVQSEAIKFTVKRLKA